MADLKTQIQQARQEGYSDDEIIQYLSGSNQQVAEALQEGYAPSEIISYVSQSKPADLKLPRQAPQMESTTGGDVMRQLGLTARAGVTGVTAIPAIAGDALNQLVRMITGANVPPVSQSIQGLMTRAGVPEPQTKQERVVQDISSALAGVGGTAALARGLAPSAQAVAPLTERLGLQATGAIGGTTAASLGREEGVGPLGQLGLAVLGGTIAPGGLGTAAQTGGRTAVQAVKPFTETGREVIAGQVLRELSADPRAAIRAAEGYRPAVPGYQPTTAQATRDVGLISAETPLRAMETQGRFLAQTSEANQARMAILDRMAKDESSLASAIKKRDEVTAPLREQAFAKVTVDPETFKSAITLNANQTIDNILASPAGKRGTVKRTMQWAKTQISEATTPQELYEIRKDLRDAAQGLLDKEGAAYSLAKGQLEQVIRSVDEVIDSAAPGYRDYLTKYSRSSKGIESLEAAQNVRTKVLSTTPDPGRVGDYLISQPAFTRAIRAIKDDPQTKLSKTQIATLERVGKDLDEGVLQRAAKVPGSDTFKNLSTANIVGGIIGRQITGEGSAAQQKIYSPLNWLYNGTDEKIRELLVEAMLDPKLAADLMKKASVMRVEPLSRELQKKAINMGYGSLFGLE
jgi:hypothetical protein